MLAFVLMLIALILFALAAISVPAGPRLNLMALGLAFMAASFIAANHP
jgi:hypothetical protein